MINWHFPRDELAKRYMNAFATGITGALALFAPRKMGKTEFVLMDLAPEAEERGYQVAYCSFWNLQDNPAKALRMSLDTMRKKGNWKEKWASYVGSTTSEISANVAGATFKLRSEMPPANEDDLIEIIHTFEAMAQKRKKVLILCDEVQHLADQKHSALVATLRTQFDQHRNLIHVVFTGSSRDGLQRMFRDRRTPMFHAAQQVDFPNLGIEFVSYMLNAFEQACQHTLSLGRATRIFTAMNNNPSQFHHLLRHMVISGLWDIEEGFTHFSTLVDLNADYRATWNQCKPIDREVLRQIALNDQVALYSDEVKCRVGHEIGVETVSTKAVQHAIERLRSNQLIYNAGRGHWVFEDNALSEWIKALPENE